MKRVFLLIVTNFAVLAVLSVTMQLLGIDRMLANETGLNLQGLLVMAAIFGFGGAFISLPISKWMAKRATGAHVIEVPRNKTERWLVDTVQRQAQAGRHRHAGSRDLRCARRQCLRHRLEPQQRAGGGQHRPAATTWPRTRPRRCWATRSATSPTATW